MPRFAFFCFTAVLASCTKSEDRAADDQTAMDTVAAAPETPAASTTISLADVAGKWKVRTMDEDGGNVVESELTATADTSGWTMTFPNRKPVPVRVVAVAGTASSPRQGRMRASSVRASRSGRAPSADCRMARWWGWSWGRFATKSRRLRRSTSDRGHACAVVAGPKPGPALVPMACAVSAWSLAARWAHECRDTVCRPLAGRRGQPFASRRATWSQSSRISKLHQGQTGTGVRG